MRFRSSLDKYRRGKPMTSASKFPIVEIQSLSNEGHGVAHIDGKAIFVSGTAPGDRVQIEVTKKSQRWARARIIKLLDSSPARIEPQCQYFEQCGGCTWQHVSYDEQLKIKQQQLMETLQRIGGLETFTMHEIVASPQPFFYRNRIRGVLEHGSFHFHQSESHELIAVESCAIARPEINEYLAATAAKQLSQRQSIELAVMPNGTVETFPLNTSRSTELGFRQVNDAVSQRLTESVSSHIQQCMTTLKATSAQPSLLDLYCGHGAWSLSLAKQHPTLRVMGVDSSAANINAANTLSKEAKNVTFIKNKVENVLLHDSSNFDFAIVDPPRAGLSQSVIDALTKHPHQSLLYISCHPATLARDLALLCAKTYSVDYVQAFDMFPQTPHVETMAVLKPITKP